MRTGGVMDVLRGGGGCAGGKRAAPQDFQYLCEIFVLFLKLQFGSVFSL